MGISRDSILIWIAIWVVVLSGKSCLISAASAHDIEQKDVVANVPAVAPATTIIDTKTLTGKIDRLYNADAEVRYRDDTEISDNGNDSYVLKHGEALISAKRTMTLKSDRYTVVIPKDAIIVVNNEDGVVKVRNLWENARKSLRVQISHKVLTIAAGEEVILAPDSNALQLSIDNDYILRRNIKLFALSCGGIMMYSEFRPVALVKHSDVLKEIVNSSDSKDKVLSGKILKMAACLAVVTSNHGIYAYLTK